MEALYVIAILAGERVALRAAEVESVIEVDVVTPVPNVPPHVAGLAALRSRVLTLIDCRVSLGLAPYEVTGTHAALVCGCEGHVYGLLVDAVEDVVSIPPDAVAPVMATLADGWSRVAAGLVTLEGETVLVIDVAALVQGPKALAA